MEAGLRHAAGWMHRRLVNLAESGALRVRVDGRMVPAQDGDDIDAWLAGRTPPSLIAWREAAPLEYAAAGVEIG